MALSVSYSYGDLLDTTQEAPADHCWKRNERHNDYLFIGALLEQLSTLEPPPPYDAHPPGYEDTLNDSPPDYTSTNVLVNNQYSQWSRIYDQTYPTYSDQKTKAARSSPDQPKIDLSSTHNIRSHANKKSKAAAKAANKAKWADSGDEGEGGSKDGGGDGSNGGGDGGSAGGGAGGDDGDGGGDDFWGDVGKKGKKKGKKGKQDEEEEADKKKDETGGAANVDNFWDDLDGGDKAEAANPDDEWATGASKKNKKKGKKVSAFLTIG